jgi:LDH2 family malate/lactate/ureidoglycolate dehydrogenase
MLALMFELICAALTGSAIGLEADCSSSRKATSRASAAFLAIDPSALAGMDRYRACQRR